MQHQAILYSLDTKVTLSQLQNQEADEYDMHRYTKLQDWATENNVGAILASDTDFHYKFLPIRQKIQIIYYIGDISLLNQKILGIVGPRQMSLYGKKVLETLFASASDYNLVTVSGMAEGVDQLCHSLSRENNIPTIAVLGGGLGRYLQRPEGMIIKEIVEAGGLVISEYKLGESPTHYTFPQRNRIIAGLADVVFLPEAGENSGSLITVDCAIATKKTVYATPNSIFSSTSAGILQYMEAGKVKPIFDLQKLLTYHFTSQKKSSRPLLTIELSDQEQLLLSALSRDQGRELHDLIHTTTTDIQEIVPLFTMLEIKGLVGQESPGKYILL